MLIDRGPFPERGSVHTTLGQGCTLASGALNAPSNECTECTEHWVYVGGYPRAERQRAASVVDKPCRGPIYRRQGSAQPRSASEGGLRQLSARCCVCSMCVCAYPKGMPLSSLLPHESGGRTHTDTFTRVVVDWYHEHALLVQITLQYIQH